VSQLAVTTSSIAPREITLPLGKDADGKPIRTGINVELARSVLEAPADQHRIKRDRDEGIDRHSRDGATRPRNGNDANPCREQPHQPTKLSTFGCVAGRVCVLNLTQ
jgi:hypothetical protein